MNQAIRAISDAKYDRCVARAVHRMRRWPAAGWVGDDSSLQTLWDHWKHELQEDESLCHDMIRDLVEDVVRRVVEGLPYEEGALLTTATDALDDLHEDPPQPIFDRDAVVRELMGRVSKRACDEPHRREVQRDIDDATRDRHERDSEVNLRVRYVP